MYCIGQGAGNMSERTDIQKVIKPFRPTVRHAKEREQHIEGEIVKIANFIKISGLLCK